MSSKIIALVFTILFGNQLLKACQCGGPNTFCQTVGENKDLETHLLKVVKLNDTLNGMVALILEDYNNVALSDTAIVWGDNGLLCRVSTSNFQTGDTLILNLILLSCAHPPNLTHEKIGDYVLSICGLFHLRVKGEKVIGRIAPGIREMQVEEFESLVESDDFEDSCLRTSVVNESEQENIAIYPNPTQNKVWIRSKYEWVEAVVFDCCGRIVQQVKMDSNDRNEIDFIGREPGVYTLILFFRNGRRNMSQIVVN